MKLSEREAEVLVAVGARLSNAQIANRLHISVRTVESHVSSLLRKYGVADRWALAEQALSDEPSDHVTGLPAARTSFVGRTRECELVQRLLADTRLVTLLGPGGIGKTRLAAEIAASSPVGGAFVDLVPVRDGFVAQAVAAALGVAERPGQTIEETIGFRLRRGRALLVLDNCEHLIDAAAGFVERMLSDCPALTVLATSRERLRVAGERTAPVPSLPLASEAEALFHDRATAADPHFTADPTIVAQICARLDGMPLAIELAAARSVSLGVGGLLDTLDDSLRLLSGGRDRDERHRSLRAVIEWSHDLLDAPERQLFRRLAIFVGGFDLAAAAAVAPELDRGELVDLLVRLVDKSLVAHGTGRWRLLETVRAYALDRLEASGEHPDVRARHLCWAVETAAELEKRYGDWREAFDTVADDLRSALAQAPPGRAAAPHQLARSLGHLTYARRFLNEAPSHYQEAARRASTPAESARDLRSASDAAHALIDTGRAFDLLLESAEQSRIAGDGDGEAIALAFAVATADRHPGGFVTGVGHGELCELLDRAKAVGDPADPFVAANIAYADVWNATGEVLMPDPELVEPALAAARATGDPVLVSSILDAACSVALAGGRLREAHRVTCERFALLVAMSRDIPYTAPEITDIYHMASACAVAVGDLPAALSVGRLAAADDLIGIHSYVGMSALITPLVLTGDFDAALRQAAPMWDCYLRSASPLHWVAPAVGALALAYGLLGDDENCRLWRSRADEVAGGPDSRYFASFAAFVDARVALHVKDFSDADRLVERTFADFPPQDRYGSYARAVGAELAVAAGRPDAADRLAAAGTMAAENNWAAACLLRAAGDRQAAAQAWGRIEAQFEKAVSLGQTG